jgi:hypothetical protein
MSIKSYQSYINGTEYQASHENSTPQTYEAAEYFLAIDMHVIWHVY